MKFNSRVIQLKVIEQMSKLCSDRFNNSIPIQTAAKIVCKNSNDPIITANRGQDLLIIITDIKYTLIGAADCYGFATGACDTGNHIL